MIMRGHSALHIMPQRVSAAIQRYISADASRYHCTVVILADSYEKLPNQCSYVIEDTETFQGMHLLKTDTYDPVQFDEAKESETEENQES